MFAIRVRQPLVTNVQYQRTCCKAHVYTSTEEDSTRALDTNTQPRAAASCPDFFEKGKTGYVQSLLMSRTVGQDESACKQGRP
jgi:hypothetical protein